LSNLSEIKNFPVLEQISFKKISNNLCVLPGLSNQLINVNTLNDSHTNLIASLFDEENLEFIESQILDTPKMAMILLMNLLVKSPNQSHGHHRCSALTQKLFLSLPRYTIKLFPIS
jgi:hypothetical protein